MSHHHLPPTKTRLNAVSQALAKAGTPTLVCTAHPASSGTARYSGPCHPVVSHCHVFTFSRCQPSVRRASVLLEVLVTVTIIAMFMALIGGQIVSAIRSAGIIEYRQTGMLLAESLVDRVQAGGFSLTDQTQQQLTGDFGDVYPGWSWQVNTEPTDDPNVLRVTMEVLQGQPNQTVQSLASTNLVTQMTTFLTIPRKVNLVDDLGLSEADASKIAAMGGNVDPTAIDPRLLAGLNLGDLSKLLPQLGPLLSQYGININNLGDLNAFASQLQGLQGLANSLGGASGTNDNDGNNSSSGSVDFSELLRLAQSGDQQAMNDWLDAHKDALNNLGKGGAK